jgi:hypothetical protein
MQALSLKTDSVAHSWPKRRSDDWLNHAERRHPRDEKRLQMTAFGGVRSRASSCPTRPVTPEVAGSSPVAPVKVPANRHIALSDRTRKSTDYTNARSSGAETAKKDAKPPSRVTISRRFRPRRHRPGRRRATTQNGRRSRLYHASRSNPERAIPAVVTDRIDGTPGCKRGRRRSPRPAVAPKLAS